MGPIRWSPHLIKAHIAAQRTRSLLFILWSQECGISVAPALSRPSLKEALP